MNEFRTLLSAEKPMSDHSSITKQETMYTKEMDRGALAAQIQSSDILYLPYTSSIETNQLPSQFNSVHPARENQALQQQLTSSVRQQTRDSQEPRSEYASNQTQDCFTRCIINSFKRTATCVKGCVEPEYTTCAPSDTEVPYASWRSEFLVRFNDPKQRIFMLTKISLVLVIIIVEFFLNIVYEVNVIPHGSITTDEAVIGDLLHRITSPVNEYLRKNDLAFSFLLATSSAVMDILVLSMWFAWAMIGNTSRLPIELFLFYGTKLSMKVLCLLPYPSGYVWHTPKLNGIRMKSLFVPYTNSADFFFSGHLGCCFIAILEHFSLGFRLGYIYGCFAYVLEATTMIFTRGHYTIDILTATVFAHWLHIMTTRMAPTVNRLLNLPPRPYITKESPYRNIAGQPDDPI